MIQASQQMRSTPITIRPARSTDIQDVFAMASDLATSFTIERHVFGVSFLRAIEETDTFLQVAEHESKRIGYLLGFAHLSFFAGGMIAGMEELYVTPEHRGMGCGTCLVESFEQWAENRGCALCFVSTRRARSFYEGFGYTVSANYMRKVLD